jgi:transposase
LDLYLELLTLSQMDLLTSQLSQSELKEIEISNLRTLLNRAEFKIKHQEDTIHYFKEQIAELTRKLFGKSSEGYLADEEQSCFNEPEFEAQEPIAEDESEEITIQSSEPITVESYQKSRGHRKPLPEYLPREKVILTLPEAELVTEAGELLKVIGYDISEKLHFEPAKIKVLAIYRAKYGVDSGDYVKITPPEPSIIPKGIATPSLLAGITVSKYSDGLPLYRQEEIFLRSDIKLPRSTMGRWMVKASEACIPLINVLSDRLLASNYVSCDETPTQVLKEVNRSPESQGFMFVRSTPNSKNKVVLFDYFPTRNQEIVSDLFLNYQGTVQTDGLGIYNVLAKNPSIKLVGCNMHGRRYFEKAVTVGSKSGQSLGKQGLDFYQELYKIEESIKDLSIEDKSKKRQELAAPLWDQMLEWSKTTLPKVPPESKIGKALYYYTAHYEELRFYLKDGSYQIDNGFIERVIRKFAIGRNNWLFHDTVGGVEASSILYSLVITAKINQVNPYEALLKIFTEIPKAQTIEDYEVLADILMGIA